MTFFDLLRSTKLYIQNYKSFGNDEQGFDVLQPINLIVGRNNSGKSALLDLIQFSCGNFAFSPNTSNRAGDVKVLLERPLAMDSIQKVFPKGTSGGPIPGDHFEFGSRYVGRRICVSIAASGNSKSFVGLDSAALPTMPPIFWQNIANSVESPFSGKSFRRLGADRNVAPEGNGDNVGIAQDGRGFTNVIQRFINQSSLPNDLVERTLLAELNKIFQPDAVFTNIRVRQHKEGAWEVYLEGQHKGAISLTHSGSGLKTVLLVLGFIILLPSIDRKPLSQYVFAFEELENNLHPSLQRRLIQYICGAALESGFAVFFTSHSSAVIDMLSHSTEAQIIHVTSTNYLARTRRVATYVENKGVLDDLDIRASDLLQSNGVVWVEGPSDRLYFNRWISLVTNGALAEGAHYQCVFYGGRLLAHLSGIQPFDISDQEEAVRIFRVNRNAILLMDSDKSGDDVEINRTKSRVSEEVRAVDGMAWITAGREVENYLTNEILERRYPGLTFSLGAYEDIADVLNGSRLGEGKKYQRNKVLFAESVVPLIEKADLALSLDLEAKVLEASKTIALWNKIEPTWI